MKYADINKRYTEIVAEHIGKGYIINSTSMGGSQGETCKIDLTNGAEIIRIMVDTFSDWNVNLKGVEIIVGRALDPDVKPHSSSGWNTLWNNRLEILFTERFYEIGEDCRHGTYYGTEEDAKAAAALKLKRYIARTGGRRTKSFNGRVAIEIAKRIIRREFGVKRIIEADIKVCKCDAVYSVGYRNKAYRLH